MVENPMKHYPINVLHDFCQSLLVAHGLSQDKASSIAETLIRGESFGSPTHGLALLPTYIREIESGGMTIEGQPTVVVDHGACLSWDGRLLPGPWLIQRAISAGIDKAVEHGMACISIQRSHHAACLKAYLQQATEAGLVIQIALTDPGHSSVAPFGGTTAVLTSCPLAFGAPTSGDPMLIDLSTSMVSNAAVATAVREKRSFTHPTLLDGYGNATTDPAVMSADPPGTILPLGGAEGGHKGYALGLMVETLSGCLSGYGRADRPTGWSAAITITLMSPDALAGNTAYLRHIDALVDGCRQATPAPGVEQVRIPGEASLARHRQCQEQGLPLSDEYVTSLNLLADQQNLSALRAAAPG